MWHQDRASARTDYSLEASCFAWGTRCGEESPAGRGESMKTATEVGARCGVFGL